MEPNNNPIKKVISEDPWARLRAFTDARIATGRTGSAMTLYESLRLRIAHAEARDVVFRYTDFEKIVAGLREMNFASLQLKTRAPNRQEYLRRPDLGRQLDEDSMLFFTDLVAAGSPPRGYDIAIVVADGLSATAVNTHLLPVLELIFPGLLLKDIPLLRFLSLTRVALPLATPWAGY